MSVGIAEARPPYVSFQTVAVEDRNASIEAGHYMTKDVDFAFITPQGSKDRVELEVESWLQMLDKEAQAGRFPMEWLQLYKRMYAAYREGNEIPLNGTSIKNWPPASPSIVANCVALNIRTVEDLAQANEETIRRLGMGARNLKQRAIEWLASASGIGKTSEELAALKVANEQLLEQNKELTSQVAELKKAVEDYLKTKPGGKPI